MNKRQWKKKYKKEHGCNPPSLKQVNHWINDLPSAMRDVENLVRKFIEKLCKDIKEFKEIIRSMPEDEFEQVLLKLTPEHQKLARKIREKKEGD